MAAESIRPRQHSADAMRPTPAAVRAHGAPAATGAFDGWAAFNAIADVWWGSQADAAGLARRAAWRLRELLVAACEAPLQAERLRAAAGGRIADPGRSRLAASHCAGLPLESIEPIGRTQAMARFDEACTDRAITLESVRAFMADPERLGAAYLGRYAVWTSSGTTGVPGIWVHDARALAVYDALEALRFGRLDRPAAGIAWVAEWMRSQLGAPQRLAMVGATGGHFAGNASIERLRRIWPWAAARARTVSIMQPLPELVAELDSYAPTVIATYPTAAELLAAERIAGRLGVRPDEIWVGGEQLSDAVRAQVSKAFGCPVRQSYGASECMSIAWECGHGGLHLNTDWVILEPVDADFRPVPPDTPSHTALLTNLANRVQPIIRYDLGDSVTRLSRPCRCGSAMPLIRIEGRRDDMLEFRGEAGPVRLLPLELVTVLEDEADTFEFQLVARDADTLALRLSADTDAPVRRAACRRALRACLDRHGLATVRIVDDPDPPARAAVSGKLRRVVRSPAP
jgi:phenylacetate-CoA ligase